MSCDHPEQKELFPEVDANDVDATGVKNTTVTTQAKRKTVRTSNGAATDYPSHKALQTVACSDAPQYLTDREVGKRFSISRPTVWRWSQDVRNAFPAPVKLSQGVTRWRVRDLLTYEAGLRPEGSGK